MVLIEWDDDRYSTNIDRFDEQHQNLFELLNDLHQAMEEGRAEEELGDILRELERYTEYHFGDEEEFMEDCGYSHDCSECFHNHQEMHENFASKVTELREKHENGEYITMEVLEFARDWLDSHIAGGDQDQNYGEYYRTEVDNYEFD
jgi:hemerythrin-like metal-binding protein